MRKLALGLVLLGLLGLPAAAPAASQTASSGNVAATFSFSGHAPRFSHERLTISQAGAVLYDQPVVSAACGSQCAPGSTFTQQSSLQVLDLEHNGQPDVLLNLFTGGAHCCLVDQVFSFDPASMTYVRTERNFGDPGAQIVDLGHDGRFEFLTADDSFAYAFTDFAASGLPVQILTFTGSRFQDITTSYPALIRKDAATWLKAFKSMARQHYPDSVGVIAAWAADEYRLGKSAAANRYLHQQARAGHLNSGLGKSVPQGQKFVTALLKFLRRHGYAH